jgi:hypothetical protein
MYKEQLAGDINIDVQDNCKTTNEYINTLSSYNIKVLNNVKTRNISSKVIDHFAANFHEDLSTLNFTIHNRLSDHNI